MRRECVPLRSVRGAFSFGTFLWASKEKYKTIFTEKTSYGDALSSKVCQENRTKISIQNPNRWLAPPTAAS
jgi:hypothetical protein